MMTSAAGADTAVRPTGLDDVEQSIARAFEAAVQSLQEDDLGAFEQTYRDLGSKLDVMLARCMRNRNATSSFQDRLPDELWSAIWEDDALMLSDHIHLSQVCHSWRRSALLSPRLWCDIPFNTCHWTICSCQPCLNIETSFVDLQFARLEALLSRSCHTALDLRLKCPDHDEIVSDDFIHRLAQALHPHTHRLVRIHAGFDDRERLSAFIRSLGDLPVLRYLSADTADGLTYHTKRVSIPISRQRMPALCSLNLSLCAFDYLLQPPGVSAPEPMLSVKEVSYVFLYESDLLRLFRSFPLLTSVTLSPLFPPNRPRYTAEFPQLPRSVNALTLVDVTNDDDYRALFDLLHRREMEVYTVRFKDTPLPTDSLASLGDLKESRCVELDVNCIGVWGISITAHDLNRRRNLTFHCHFLDDSTSREDTSRTVLSTVWEYLPLSAVDTLVVDAETWAALPPSPPPSAPRTTELRVLLGDKEQYPFPWTGPHPAQFPALTRMVVESRNSYPEVTAESLAAFIQSLGIELGGAGNKLSLVVRDGVVLLGDEAVLREMCTISRDV